jgi:peptidyl-tRNA hydrolase, PTH1 family
MKLIVGLGNPGKEYEKTRHNAGANFVAFIAKKREIIFSSKFQSLYAEFNDDTGEKIILLQPQTFMNNSGSAVLEAVKFYKLTPENVFIAFDDLDILEGDFKIQIGKHPKIHNGINDITTKTKTDQYYFIRIGVDSRSIIERKFLKGSNYVLKKTDYNFIPVYEKIVLELDKRFGLKLTS